jgi:hypothetical protein
MGEELAEQAAPKVPGVLPPDPLDGEALDELLTEDDHVD